MRSGVFWIVLMGSDTFWCIPGAFCCVLFTSGGFHWILVWSGRFWSVLDGSGMVRWVLVSWMVLMVSGIVWWVLVFWWVLWRIPGGFVCTLGLCGAF
jgi:hypothetical protein